MRAARTPSVPLVLGVMLLACLAGCESSPVGPCAGDSLVKIHCPTPTTTGAGMPTPQDGAPAW